VAGSACKSKKQSAERQAAHLANAKRQPTTAIALLAMERTYALPLLKKSAISLLRAMENMVELAPKVTTVRQKHVILVITVDTVTGLYLQTIVKENAFKREAPLWIWVLAKGFMANWPLASMALARLMDIA
jgi:hypothetical protein